jgi:hypothetical protein
MSASTAGVCAAAVEGRRQKEEGKKEEERNRKTTRTKACERRFDASAGLKTGRSVTDPMGLLTLALALSFFLLLSAFFLLP